MYATFLCSVLFTLTVCANAQAQVDTVRVGDPEISASFIQPFEIEWVARRHLKANDSTFIQYKVSEKYEIFEEGGERLLRFTQVWNNEKGDNLFTTVRTADLETMGYKAFHTGSVPGGITHLDIDGRYISGFTALDAHKKAKPIGSFIAEPTFASFSGVLYAVLLRDHNQPVTYPGFGFGGETPVLRYETLEVEGTESLRIAGKSTHRAKIVKGSNAPALTYWIDTNKAPYFLKVIVEQGDGSTTYEVESYRLITN